MFQLFPTCGTLKCALVWSLFDNCYDRNTGSFQDSEALFQSCCDLYGACWCILAQIDGIYSCQCNCLTIVNSPSFFFTFCCFSCPLCACLFPKQRKFELYTDPCLFQARWFPLRVSKMAAHWSLSLRLNGLAKPTLGVYKYSFTRQSAHANMQFFNEQ